MLQKLLNLDFFNRKNEELKILEDENSDNLEIREEPLQPNDNDGQEEYENVQSLPDTQETESSKILRRIKATIEGLPESKQKTPFSQLELTTRSMNIFQREDVHTPYDLLHIENAKILKWYMLGVRSLKDIAEATERLARSETQFELLTEGDTVFPVQASGAGWFDQFINDHPEMQSVMNDLGITNDQTYMANRNKLREDVLRLADDYRFDNLIEKIAHDDPIEILSIGPLWLLEMDTFYFECDTRIKNVIANHEIGQMKDFCRFTSSELLRLQNMGCKSMARLSEAIIAAQKKGPPPTQDNPETSATSLLDGFSASLEKIEDPNHRKIIEERLGVAGESKTLEEIAQDLGLTRERVRQIQSKVTAKIIDGEFWDDTLRFKIEKMLKAPSLPLFIDNLGANDTWLSGFESKPLLLQKLIENFSHLEPKFLTVGDRVIMTAIDAEKWANIKTGLLDSFEYSLDLQYTLEDIELLIENELAKVGAMELAGLMFDEIYSVLNFSMNGDDFILVSIGNTVGSHLKTILEESPTPLHYREIRDKYEEKYGVNISERNTHARLAYKGFYLYDRGTFGTEKHFPLTDAEKHFLINFATEKAQSSSGKQWHTDEILKLLKKECPDQIPAQLDKYILNIALGDAPGLIYLGRLIWVDSAIDTELERQNIGKAVADILRKKGKPLRVEEIEKEILKIRSVGTNFSTSLQPNELYSRVDPATWGLLDRDFILPPKEWESVKSIIYSKFKEDGKALHTSEIPAFLKSMALPAKVNSGHLLGVLSVDPRFRKWRGGFIGLSEWDAPNRLTVTEALEQAVPAGTDNIDVSHIEESVQKIVGYNFDRNRISIHLNKCGFIFDREENSWKKAA